MGKHNKEVVAKQSNDKGKSIYRQNEFEAKDRIQIEMKFFS